jgi:hypothetical protein
MVSFFCPGPKSLCFVNIKNLTPNEIIFNIEVFDEMRKAKCQYLTWKCTSFARFGSAMKTWCRWEQMRQ